MKLIFILCKLLFASQLYCFIELLCGLSKNRIRLLA
jgi:hypothetical protein